MKFLTRSLLTAFAILFVFGCASKQMSSLPSFEAAQFDSSQYTSKVDNFLVIFDASSSMIDNGNFETAQAIVSRMNDTIPEMGQVAGLRSFGHALNVTRAPTKLFYGMETYSTDDLKSSLGGISNAGGASPLNRALTAAATDLKDSSGQTAVIIVTDGKELPGSAVTAAQELEAQHSGSLCFYPILVGDDTSGEGMLKQIAGIGECGSYSTYQDVLTSDGMAGFVENTFLEKKDEEPVAERKDSDNDGVYDDEDECPGTPAGAVVNSVGCWVLGNVLFDTAKDVIKPEAYSLLDDVAGILEENSIMSIELHGHTDNVGSAAYNNDLSLRRARAVKAYLVDKGILKNRIATEGFGFSKPAALNGTEEGRAMNRRVEIHPY